MRNRLLIAVLAISASVLAFAPNTPPDAVNDSAATRKNKSVNINVLANDTDPDPGTLFFVSILTNPSHGNAVVNANMAITYTPAHNYQGPDAFKYLLEDGAGGSDTATVSITVN